MNIFSTEANDLEARALSRQMLPPKGTNHGNPTSVPLFSLVKWRQFLFYSVYKNYMK